MVEFRWGSWSIWVLQGDGSQKPCRYGSVWSKQVRYKVNLPSPVMVIGQSQGWMVTPQWQLRTVLGKKHFWEKIIIMILQKQWKLPKLPWWDAKQNSFTYWTEKNVQTYRQLMIKSDGHTLKHSNFSKEKSHISVLLRYELYIKVKFSKYIYIYTYLK